MISFISYGMFDVARNTSIAPLMPHHALVEGRQRRDVAFLFRKGQAQPMKVASKYSIHDLNTGQVVAFMDADGTLSDEGDPQAIARLKALLQRELVVREKQFAFEAEDDEGYELFPEGSMCYIGLITLRPGDPEYLAAFLDCLPTISPYVARAVRD